VTYPGDSAVIAWLILTGCFFTVWMVGWRSWQAWMINTDDFRIHILPCVFLTIFCTRLILAERLYLRIRHGTSMMIASQVMVGLTYAKLSLMAEGY